MEDSVFIQWTMFSLNRGFVKTFVEWQKIILGTISGNFREFVIYFGSFG